MKKVTLRLLLAVLLIGALVGALASCGDAAEFTVKVMDGETLVKEYSFEEGAAIVIPSADLAKPGYKFDGLYTDAAMTEKLAEDATVTGDLTLYAKYTAKTFYLYVDNGLGDEDEIEVTYGQPYTLTVPEKDGYRFKNYSYNNAEFTLTGTYTYTDDITVVAKWDKIVYLNVFNGTTSVKVEVAADGSYTLPDVADTADKTFEGYLNGTEPFGSFDAESGKWVGKYTGTADLTLTYNWQAIPSYRLTVNGLYDDDAVAPRSYKAGEAYSLPAAPTRDGYRFLGYRLGTETFAASGTCTWTENITVTAVWEKILYVTVMNGTTQVGTAFELPADGSFTLPDVADTADNRFLGYNGPAGFTAVFNDDEGEWDCTYNGTDSITVYYNWEGIRHITFQTNGPVAIDPILIGSETTYTLPALADTATHYFLGFKRGNAEITGTTYTLTADEIAGEDDVVLTAVYAEKHFVTIYDGAAILGEKLLIAKDGSVILPKQDDTALKLFAGYTAAGITFTKNGDGTYTAAGLSADLAVSIAWYVLPTATLDPADGVLAGSATVTLTVGNGKLPVPVRDGFAFLGWKLGTEFFTDKEGNYTLTADRFASGKDDLLLVAVWQNIEEMGEVEGKNYFKELDASTGEILYVFLTGTGNQYLFTGYTLTLSNVTNNAVTLNADANGFTANATGSFKMTLTAQNGSTRTVSCKVETRISTFASAKATDEAYAKNFKNGIAPLLNAGVTNLVPDIAVRGFRNNADVKLSLADIPYVLSVQIFNGEGYEDASDTAYSVESGSVYFGSELIGKQVKLTFAPKYALKADKQAVSFEYLLNNGINVYTNDELYDAFNNNATTLINVMRNIEAHLQPEHTAAGHDPNCTCERGDLSGITNAANQPVNQYEHGVYYREQKSENEQLTIHGNYYKIDGSKLPAIDPRNKAGAYSDGSSKYSGNFGYAMTNVQVGIFSYYGNKNSDSFTTSPTLSIDNLYIHGSFSGDSTEVAANLPGSSNTDNILKGSMAFHGIVTRYVHLNLSNSTIHNTHIALFNTGIAGEPRPNALRAVVNVDGVIIDSYMSQAFYLWGQVGLTLKNTEVGQGAGVAITVAEGPIAETHLDKAGYVKISHDTTIKNYVTGNEAWFQALGRVQDAAMVKTMLSNMLAPAGMTPITPDTIAGGADTQAFNCILIVMENNKDHWTNAAAGGNPDKIGMPYTFVYSIAADGTETQINANPASPAPAPCGQNQAMLYAANPDMGLSIMVEVFKK